jgi:hypothetical protein
MVSDLLVHGFDYAARWYSLIAPPGTFRRRTGALSGTTAGSSQLVGFQNSATVFDQAFYAARSYSLMRPPRTGRRLIRS